MKTKQAKDFLVQQAGEQAARENVPLSDMEERMMYFTERDASSCDKPLELNDEFEAQMRIIEVQAILEREGIHVRLNATCIELTKLADGEVGVHLNCTEGPPEVGGSHLLLAMGRTPNTGDLGLERPGVARDGRGYILVDNQLRTNIPSISALGDCNGRGGFTHTSYNDFEIVAANPLDHEPRSVTDRITAYNNIQDRGDCQTPRKSYRTSHSVDWVVG